MALAKPSIELCKGSNGLEKVVLKEARGSSIEALGWDFVLEISVQDLLLCTLDLVSLNTWSAGWCRSEVGPNTGVEQNFDVTWEEFLRHPDVRQNFDVTQAAGRTPAVVEEELFPPILLFFSSCFDPLS
ncbi:glucose-6-phosphate 1-epimerase [Dendrobium catenatum]|uniref:Glucose-6-phosphate 1-epimerase n=1 Tax=Dendrobium catenatum TaxID=906689 RepID=A0A2I0W5X1_9ASPA|nr:glucose-6-phosphate 1-epimerase [Dendrobium catenatum]